MRNIINYSIRVVFLAVIFVILFSLAKITTYSSLYNNDISKPFILIKHNYTPTYCNASVATTGSVSIKTFGAKGDGITDDSIAFNNALKNLKGQILFIPKGTYIINETVFIPSNTSIVGEGESSILKASNGFPVGDDILKIYNNSNISIANIAIDGNSSINNKAAGHSHIDGVHLLDIWNASNITVEKCHFKDNIYAAIRLINGNSNSIIRNCTFKNLDCGVIALGSGNVTHLTIDNCAFNGHDNSESISLFGTGHYSDITISNNIMKNKKLGHAIFCAKGTIDNIKILNNQLFDNCYSIKLDRVNTATISGNYITNSNSLNLNGGKGIVVTNSSNINVASNTFTKTCGQAIYVADSSNINIYSNKISNCGYISSDYHALDLRGKCSSVSVYNNTFTRTDNKLSIYSLVSHSTGTVNIYNNTFSNCYILLHSDSSNVKVSNNNTTVKNQGKNNSVTN